MADYQRALNHLRSLLLARGEVASTSDVRAGIEDAINIIQCCAHEAMQAERALSLIVMTNQAVSIYRRKHGTKAAEDTRHAAVREFNLAIENANKLLAARRAGTAPLDVVSPVDALRELVADIEASNDVEFTGSLLRAKDALHAYGKVLWRVASAPTTEAAPPDERPSTAAKALAHARATLYKPRTEAAVIEPTKEDVRNRKPLTEEQIIEATDHIDMNRPGVFIRVARAIERAHGIGAISSMSEEGKTR